MFIPPMKRGNTTAPVAAAAKLEGKIRIRTNVPAQAQPPERDVACNDEVRVS
jgi:hypothetical protein